MQRNVIITLSAVLMIASVVGAINPRFNSLHAKINARSPAGLQGNTLQFFSAVLDSSIVDVQTVFDTNATTTFSHVNASTATSLALGMPTGIVTVNILSFGTATVVATTTLNFTGSSAFTLGLYGITALVSTLVHYTDDNTLPAVTFGRLRVINGISGEQLLVFVNAQEVYGNATLAFQDATAYTTVANGNTFVTAHATVANKTVLISDFSVSNGAVNTIVAIPGVNNTISSILVSAVAGTTPITLPGGTTAPGAAASIFPTPAALVIALLFALLSLL